MLNAKSKPMEERAIPNESRADNCFTRPVASLANTDLPGWLAGVSLLDMPNKYTQKASVL
jgi:hypothetical protein